MIQYEASPSFTVAESDRSVVREEAEGVHTPNLGS